MKPILLDTCALIWIGENSPLSRDAEALLERADAGAGHVFISPISAWEIGQLVAKGRLALTLEPRAWFQRALDGGFQLAPMPPEVLIASSYLPSSLLRDPADKIVAATARTYQYVIMTRDRPLLAFAEEGHADAVRC